MSADLERLRTAWEQLLRPFRPEPEVVTRGFADLCAAYSQEGRFYHNLAHIQHVLETIAGLGDQARNLPAIVLAAWFHDVVYDSRAGDNEERSAVHAGQVLATMHVPAALSARVQELILLTRTHQAAADDGDGHIFLDADLAVLGSPTDDYRHYARAIRQEYGWVPEETYRQKRKEVLRHFLERDHIYRTEKIFLSRESQARQNLALEIESLD